MGTLCSGSTGLGIVALLVKSGATLGLAASTTTAPVVTFLKVHVLDHDGQGHHIELVERRQGSVVELHLKVVLVGHDVDTVADALPGDRGYHGVAGVASSHDLQINVLTAAHPAKLTAGHESDHLRGPVFVFEGPGRQSTPRALRLVNASELLSSVGLDDDLLRSATAVLGAWVAEIATRAAATRVGAVERSFVRQVRLSVEVDQLHVKWRKLLAALADAAV